MPTLQAAFIKNWRQKCFPQPAAQKVLLALSGGLDSMALAHLLLDADISFAAAHCNFSLRGNDADEDAAFVQAWCSAQAVTLHIIRFDTESIAAERKQSIQTAARDLRYEWFGSLRKTHGYAAILTAHHADDIAETMLINLCRGTGIAGLHGIPERNGRLLRPLLFATRAEIAEYAAARNIAWREDASNASDKYLRNALRHHVLPKLESLMPGAARRMAETAERVKGAEAVYRYALAKKMRSLLQPRGKDYYIPIRLLRRQESLAALAFELFTPFGYSPDQLPHILRLMDSPGGRQVHSQTNTITRHRDFLVVTGTESEKAGLLTVGEVPCTIETAEGSFSFSWMPPPVQLPDDPSIACLHGDDLALPFTLRTRREGDYFYPLGMGMKKKKLKRFLIDIKTPQREKDRIRILECDQRILWVAGKRIDERFKVRPATKRMLKVVFQPF